jgi:hypothetical protein
MQREQLSVAPLPIFKDYYTISNHGKIVRLERISININGVRKRLKEKEIKHTFSKNKYPCVSISVNGICKRVYVHRMMAIAFIPNPENKPEVNHKDGNRSNFSLNNLEWVTAKENVNHAIETGLANHVKGEDAYFSKLTEKKVLAIRRLHRINPKFNRRALSRKIGVSHQNISDIVNNKAWKYLLQSN